MKPRHGMNNFKPCAPSYDGNMRLPDRILADPEILAGTPVIRGTRLSAAFVLQLLAAGESEGQVRDNYPGLTKEDLQACLAYASCLELEFQHVSAHADENSC